MVCYFSFFAYSWLIFFCLFYQIFKFYENLYLRMLPTLISSTLIISLKIVVHLATLQCQLFAITLPTVVQRIQFDLECIWSRLRPKDSYTAKKDDRKALLVSLHNLIQHNLQMLQLLSQDLDDFNYS
jgi:hypothetical protein